ncbi:MAG: arylsulfatase A-like enzyme [Myxococcota bacterium]
MLRHTWYGLSSGLIAGLIVGLIEAVSILAGINTGEYAALLFAAVLYSLAGALIGVGVGLVLAILHRLFGTSDPTSWAMGFAAVTSGLSWLVLRGAITRSIYNERSLDAAGEVVLLLGCVGGGLSLVWLGSILLHRTPLKILRRPRGTAAFYAIMLVLAAVFSLTPGRPSGELDKHQPPDLAEHPNILFIVVDALRTDRLGAYGGSRGLTPTMDRLAAEGIVFEQAFAHAAWTRPAMASLMTSSPPAAHGTDRRISALPESAETLAEVLSNRSYLTAAIPNSRDVARAQRFQQGFDRFDYHAPRMLPGATESAQRLTLYGVLRRLHTRSGAPQRVVSYYRPAEDVVGAARELISSAGGQRWFLWTHLMEPHPPYFYRPLDGRAELLPGTVPQPQDVGRVQAQYDAEVRWVDARLGELIEWLREQGQLEHTAIVLTSDHGTELLDHGGWGFGETLYDEILHVPLIIRLPDQQHAGARVDWQVRQLDIAPTIAGLVGAPPPDTWQGRDLLEPGFESWLLGEAPPPKERPIIAESTFRGSEMAALRAEGWKYIRVSPGHPRRLRAEELYQTGPDPHERESLAGREGAMQARMSSRLRQSRERLRPPPADAPR